MPADALGIVWDLLEDFEPNEDPPVMNIQYDGLTTGSPMRVLLTDPVIIPPGFTYHVKGAIVDAEDYSFASAVFIRAAVPCQ